VATRQGLRDPFAVSAILALGAAYSLLDTLSHRRGQVFLNRWPLFVSLMESIFIALLCYFDIGLESPFRWYYLLSLICCSVRYEPPVAWTTFLVHSLSLIMLGAATDLGFSAGDRTGVALPIVILAWVTWASSSFAGLLRSTGSRLEQANAELKRHRADLEVLVEARTSALQASLARELQKEKLSAFGLLAAGIAHEVGNPLAALSSLVQMIQRRKPDPYTAEKLDLAARQLDRIRRTLRELVDFSRPVSGEAGPVRLAEVADEALGIVKYYHRTKGREIRSEIPAGLPVLWTVRDHLTQVLFNLLLNAIDATPKGGQIRLTARQEAGRVFLAIEDNGVGVRPEQEARLFVAYQTTKRNGTGLGLFVSRQIVQELGGGLEFRPRPGGGSIFTVELPVGRAVPEARGEMGTRVREEVAG
jgi:signal transduction histidine kinase